MSLRMEMSMPLVRASLVFALLLFILVVVTEGADNDRELYLNLRPSKAFAIEADDYNVKLLREDGETGNVINCSLACLKEQGGMAPCVAVKFDAAASTCKLWTQPEECAPYELNGVNDLEVSLTADNTFKVWADGALVGTDGAWNVNKKYTVPKYTHIIAVYATNVGSEYGLLGSMSSGVWTDASWKCVQSSAPDTAYPGWKKPCYDDSAWETPAVLGSKGMAPWGHSGSTYISTAAKWIWTSGGANNIMCRATPHRCLLSSQPARSADPSVICTMVTPADPATVLGSGTGQFIRLGSVLWHICDDATRVGMRCDVNGQWEVMTMPNSHTIL